MTELAQAPKNQKKIEKLPEVKQEASQLQGTVLPKPNVAQTIEQKITNILRTDYSMSSPGIANYYIGEYGAERLLEALKTENVRSNFKFFESKDCYDMVHDPKLGTKKQSSTTSLGWAIKTQNFSVTEIKAGIEATKDFKVLPEALIQEFLPLREDLGYAKSPEFLEFHEHLNTFSPTSRTEIPDEIILFKECKNNKNLMRTFHDGSFAKVLALIRSEFPNYDSHRNDFLSMAKIAANTELDQLKNIIDKIKQNGETLKTSDIGFIAELMGDKKQLEELKTKDLAQLRKEHLAKVDSYFESLTETAPRAEMGILERYQTELEKAEAKGDKKSAEEIKQKMQSVRTDHNVRPDTNQLNTLETLRLSLIIDGLTNNNTLGEISQIVQADLADKRTEYGGEINLDGGKASFNPKQSGAMHNGQFNTSYYNHFPVALATFHLHATELDDSKYAGPSGNVGPFIGDIDFGDLWHVHMRGRYDVVITSMGHPKTEHGTSDTSKLRINADFYFTKRVESGEAKQYIFDLGVFEVPYKQ